MLRMRTGFACAAAMEHMASVQTAMARRLIKLCMGFLCGKVGGVPGLVVTAPTIERGGLTCRSCAGDCKRRQHKCQTGGLG